MSKEEEAQSSLTSIPQYHFDLTKVRIIQKSVVYVIGLSSALANKEILSKEEYFGQYGQILKLVVNKNGYAQNRQSESTYSAYVTFASPENAALALLAIDNTEIDGHIIRSSFGTTKYCSFFLRNMECANKDCLYLHALADEGDTLYKEDSYSNKTIFYQQQRIAMKIADVSYKEYKPKGSPVSISSGFPSISSINQKEFLFDNNSTYNFNHYPLENMRKYSAYDSFSQYTYQRNDKVAEEEVEYILVKEPSKKNRKWKPCPQVSKGEMKKRKRNYTLEDIQRPKQISSPSSASTNTSNQKQSPQTKRRMPIFSTATQSRFTFVNKTDNSECPDIPEFVHDMIYKITSSFSFFRQFDSNIVNDKEVFSDEYKQLHQWSPDPNER